MPRTIGFFRHRDQDQGWTQVFEFSVLDVGRAEIAIYCRRAPKEKPPQIQDLQLQKLKGCYGSLQQFVDRAGGGIALMVTHRSDRSDLEIWRSQAADYTFPSRFLLLSVGLPPSLIDASRPSTLNRGERVLVPVDSIAETELEALLGHLRWLSSDVEAIVLDGLIRPSIESRLTKLERVHGDNSSRKTSALVALLSKLFRVHLREPPQWLDRAFRIILLALAAFLLMAVQALLVERLIRETISGNSDPEKSTARQNPLEQLQDQRIAFEQLRAALIQFPASSNEAALARSFQSLSAGSPMNTEAIAYGLVKLIAALEGPKLTADELKPDAYSEAKLLLQRVKPQLTDAEKLLLAYVTCNAFPQNRTLDSAGIKEFTSGNQTGRVALEVKCTKVLGRHDLGTKGLQALTEKLEKRLQQT